MKPTAKRNGMARYIFMSNIYKVQQHVLDSIKCTRQKEKIHVPIH